MGSERTPGRSNSVSVFLFALVPILPALLLFIQLLSIILKNQHEKLFERIKLCASCAHTCVKRSFISDCFPAGGQAVRANVCEAKEKLIAKGSESREIGPAPFSAFSALIKRTFCRKHPAPKPIFSGLVTSLEQRGKTLPDNCTRGYIETRAQPPTPRSCRAHAPREPESAVPRPRWFASYLTRDKLQRLNMTDKSSDYDNAVRELDEAFRALAEVRRSLPASSEHETVVRNLGAHVDDGFLGQAVPWPAEVISAIAQVYQDLVTVIRYLLEDKAGLGDEAKHTKRQRL